MNIVTFLHTYGKRLFLAIVLLIGLEALYLVLQIRQEEWFGILGLLFLASTILSAAETFKPQTAWHIRFIPYLVHPVFLFTGTWGFIFFNHTTLLAHIAIIISTIGFMILFSELVSDLTHHAHDAVKFWIIFLLYNAAFEVVRELELSHLFLFAMVFSTTLLFFTHMFWRLKAPQPRFFILGALASLMTATFAWYILSEWIIASFMPLSIMTVAVYYVWWGIFHHEIQEDLTWKIALEYLLIGSIVVTIFLGMTTGIT